MSTLLSILMSAGCLSAAALLFRQPQKLSKRSKNTALLLLVCLGFILIWALGRLILPPDVLRFFSQLTYFIALPMLASLLLAQRLSKDWSRAAWGRWMLALFALFELCRRLEWGAEYGQILHLTSILAILAAFWPANRWGLLASLLLGISILLIGPYALPIIPTTITAASESWHLLSLSIALPLLGLASGKLLAAVEA